MFALSPGLPWLHNGVAILDITLTTGFVGTVVSFSFSFSYSSRWHRSAHKGPSLGSLPKVALKTVPVFFWLNTDCSRPWSVEHQPSRFLSPFLFPSGDQCCDALFRKLLTPLSTSALLSCRPDVIPAALASFSAGSFPLTPACPGQKIHRSLWSLRLCIAVCQLGQLMPDSTFCRWFIESVIRAAVRSV